MKVVDILSETYIDNVSGKGAVPYNQDIDYFGLSVQMKPSVFLTLAAPLDKDQATSVPFLVQHLSQGGKIGAPFLVVEIPEGWKTNNFTERAVIKEHDGRNRMLALQEVQGDVPVEVHFIPRGGLRSRDLRPEWIEEMKKSLKAEKSGRIVVGPLFATI